MHTVCYSGLRCLNHSECVDRGCCRQDDKCDHGYHGDSHQQHQLDELPTHRALASEEKKIIKRDILMIVAVIFKIPSAEVFQTFSSIL